MLSVGSGVDSGAIGKIPLGLSSSVNDKKPNDSKKIDVHSSVMYSLQSRASVMVLSLEVFREPGSLPLTTLLSLKFQPLSS